MSNFLPAQRVLVAVPARNEQELVGAALSAIIDSAAELRAHRDLSVVVGVAAHKCTDDTFAVAARQLTAAQGIEAVVVRDTTSTTVGEARHRLIARLAGWSSAASGTWVLSTDADSIVPRDWMSRILQTAERQGAVAVAGMTELVDWAAVRTARAHYEQIIAAGLTEGGGHRHVYAANLAVRLDAYLDAGGFPAVSSGEDHALIRAVRAGGGRVATPREPRVHTSGRMPGRAAHGLAGLLTTL